MIEDTPEIELCAGRYPFSKKPCLTLQIGGSIRILARFDNEKCLRAFLACQPTYDHSRVTRERLEAIWKETDEKSGG